MTGNGRMDTMIPWNEVEPVLRSHAYEWLDSQPEVLLDRDDGPEGATASVVYGRLIGFDDQIERDGWRMERVQPVLLLPISNRLTVAEPDLDPMCVMPRTARYVLQASYSTVSVAAELVRDVPGDPRPDAQGLHHVLYVRYRRRI